MGDSKRRREKDQDYGAIAFRDSVIKHLNEHLELRGDRNFSVAILRHIPTTEKITNAASVFCEWAKDKSVEGMIVFGVGDTVDDALSVGVAMGTQVKIVQGSNVSDLLAALVTSAKGFAHSID